MRAKSGFILRDIGGTHVLVPLGERVVDFNGLITLNSTGRCLWQQLSTHDCTLDELSAVLVEHFTVTPEQAMQDASAFTDELARNGLLDDDSGNLRV